MYRCIRVAVLFFSAAAWATDATPARQISSARRLIHDVKYTDAAKLIDDALARGGLEREPLIELLELQGIVQASLGAHDRALAAYSKLVSLAPQHELPADLAPKVKAPFVEAVSRLGARDALALEARLDALELSARALNDPLKLARAVRFHLRSADGAWETRDLPADEAQLKVPQVQVEWYAELLDAASDVLARAGNAADPRIANVPVAIEAPTPDLREQPPAPPQPEPEATRSHAALAISIVLGVAGLGAAAVGGGFGWTSRADRNAFNAALMQAMPVTAYTAQSAGQLNVEVRTDAIIANVLFAAAAVLIVAGIAVLIFGN